MKFKKNSANEKISRVDIQVSIMTAGIVMISALLIFLFSYCLTYNDMIHTLQQQAHGIYSFVENQLDKETFRHINSLEDQSKASYNEMKRLLEDVKTATGVRYLYTGKRLENGTLIYVIDGLDSSSPDFRNAGDPIEEEIWTIMEEALMDRVIMPDRIESTSWGHVFVSYFPIHSDGEVIGVLGIEFDADHQFYTYAALLAGTALIMVMVCFAAVMISARLFRRISNPSYRDLASTDFLTGFKNRNAFEIDMNNLSGTPRQEGCALISIDLDGLKTINDTFGHPAGDAYIRSAGEVLQSQTQADMLYRVGGDEFAVILCGSSEDRARGTVEQIMRGVRSVREEGGNVALSIGYAVFDPQQDANVFDTYRRADREMYREKARKREKRA